MCKEPECWRFHVALCCVGAVWYVEHQLFPLGALFVRNPCSLSHLSLVAKLLLAALGEKNMKGSVSEHHSWDLELVSERCDSVGLFTNWCGRWCRSMAGVFCWGPALQPCCKTSLLWLVDSAGGSWMGMATASVPAAGFNGLLLLGL